MIAILYLLPLGLAFDLAGYMPPELRVGVFFGLMALPLCLRPSRQSGLLACVLLAAAVLRAWWTMPPVAELAWLLLVHQAVWTVHGGVPRALRAGVVAYAVMHFLLFLSPLGHPVTEALTGAGNGLLKLLTGSTFHLGPTWLGVGSLLLFTVLAVFARRSGRIETARMLAFPPLALLFGALSAALLMERAALVDKEGLTSAFTWSLKFREPFGWTELAGRMKEMIVIFFPIFLFAGHLVIFLTLHGWKWGGRPETTEETGGWDALKVEFRGGWRRWAVPAAVLCLAVLATPPTAWRGGEKRELIFVEKGVVSYSKPNYQQFGEYAGGMFGMLPEYAALFGHRSQVVKEVPESLDPGQALVLTNLDSDFGEDTRRRIWDFVSRGGALVLLGDHTFIKNGKNHLNQMLEPVRIRFVNDSAQFLPQGWFHSYRFIQGTPFGGLRDDAENRPGILVGASLALEAPAHPLVVGRHGFSDLGTEVADERQGHLGDFQYQRRERLGDLVLVAGQRHGDGRVLVFGDTSSFFNTNLARSHELLRSSLAYINEGNGWLFPMSGAGRMIAWLLLGGALAGLFLGRLRETGIAVLAALWLPPLTSHRDGGLPEFDLETGRKRLAIIDFSTHPNASKHTATDRGLHGVSLNLLRHGKLPVAANHWDADLLDRARYVVLNAPRRPVTARELRTLTTFMKRGGTVILSCGHLDTTGASPLLEQFGIEVGDTPLGRFFNLEAFGSRVSFMSAWGIAKLPPDARILCQSPDWPLMAAVPVGRGELVFIADSEFLLNRNVEGHKNHDPQNTTFLKNLFDSLEQ